MALAHSAPEEILDPDLPCIDPHHHVWLMSDHRLKEWIDDWPSVGEVVADVPQFLFPELHANVTGSGHNFVATMYADAQMMFKADGPEHLKPVGEIEFANGLAAISASGEFGKVRLCAGIIGEADLTSPLAEETLRAEIVAGGGRFRGIRAALPRDEDVAAWVRGAGVLRDLGLTLNVFTTEPGLPHVIRVAEQLEGLPIIVEHVGAPTMAGEYAGTLQDRFPIWEANMRTLAGMPHLNLQLGALSVPFTGFASWRADPPWTSEQIAAEWAPYMVPAIEMFGADRCMFESDFPYMAGACTYQVLWNTFKRVARQAGASQAEKEDLFAGTARRVYSLDLPTD
jgi:predicted TIM-barrel fold metal-dependent hydrolase